MVKVRQVLERKTETVTSTFATRMLSIDQCVIQYCLLLSENSNYILYGIVTKKNGDNSKLYEKLSILFL
jgi:hypothetical protein